MRNGCDILLKTTDLKFPCFICGRTYRHKKNRNTHMKYECGRDPSIFCPYCAYRCRRKGDLKSHIANRHRLLQ